MLTIGFSFFCALDYFEALLKEKLSSSSCPSLPRFVEIESLSSFGASDWENESDSFFRELSLDLPRPS